MSKKKKKKGKYVTKKIKPYNTTRTKSRNFLSNISYNGVKEEDLFDRDFVFDIYTLVTKNINPFSLEQKIFDVKNREMICMFWEECNEPSFYKHIWKPENFLYLNVPVANKKELVNDQDFENEKLLTDERKLKEMEEQKNRKCKRRREIVAEIKN